MDGCDRPWSRGVGGSEGSVGWCVGDVCVWCLFVCFFFVLLLFFFFLMRRRPQRSTFFLNNTAITEIDTNARHEALQRYSFYASAVAKKKIV